LPHVSASYNGINIPILWRAQITNGYRTASWMTYRQALELGAQVRGGEKSTHVVFTKQLNVKDKETDEEKKIGMLKAYSVFNVAQIDGVPAPATGLVEKTPDQRRDHVDTFIAATKADIRIGGDRACYVPSLDFICLPPESAFKSREHFLATSPAYAGYAAVHGFPYLATKLPVLAIERMGGHQVVAPPRRTTSKPSNRATKRHHPRSPSNS
jgi:antirestriction protein ArdC